MVGETAWHTLCFYNDVNAAVDEFNYMDSKKRTWLNPGEPENQYRILIREGYYTV